jgi:MFS family permease
MQGNVNHKWFVLILAAMTGAFAIGVPAVSLAVLFPEISRDLHLDLVQMGLLWSIGSLPAILTSPLSGALDDRFGPKRVAIAGILLVSLTAAARGLAGDFTSLLLIIVAVGGLVPLITTSLYKICGVWFPRAQLGLANGALSMGMALGGLLGSLLSATVLSPWLGGWRQVLFLYGGLALLLLLPWAFVRSVPADGGGVAAGMEAVPMRRALAHVVRLREVWLIGIVLLGIGGCVQGVAGYLPVYLRGLGWAGASADGALSLINAMSMLCVLPIALWSDRMGARRTIVIGAAVIIATGTGILSAAAGGLILAAVILMGMVRDGTTALLITMAIESDGVGPVYAGSASGFVMFFFFAGNLLAPPLGNKLAGVSAGLPFVFWAALAMAGAVIMAFTKVPRRSSA